MLRNVNYVNMGKKKQINFANNLRMGIALIVGVSVAVSCTVAIVILLLFVAGTKLGI